MSKSRTWSFLIIHSLFSFTPSIPLTYLLHLNYFNYLSYIPYLVFTSYYFTIAYL